MLCARPDSESVWLVPRPWSLAFCDNVPGASPKSTRDVAASFVVHWIAHVPSACGVAVTALIVGGVVSEPNPAA